MEEGVGRESARCGHHHDAEDERVHGVAVEHTRRRHLARVVCGRGVNDGGVNDGGVNDGGVKGGRRHLAREVGGGTAAGRARARLHDG